MFKYRDPIHIILSRLFLAIVFTVSGLSGFMELGVGDYFTLNQNFVGEIASSPHFYALKSLELIIGFTFLANFFIPTSLLIAAPIALSAIGYHLWINPPSGVILMILLVPIVILFAFYKDTYKVFFRPQFYAGHMSEDTPKILIYDEVQEKSPKLLKKFEEVHASLNKS